MWGRALGRSGSGRGELVVVSTLTQLPLALALLTPVWLLLFGYLQLGSSYQSLLPTTLPLFFPFPSFVHVPFPLPLFFLVLPLTLAPPLHTSSILPSLPQTRPAPSYTRPPLRPHPHSHFHIIINNPAGPVLPPLTSFVPFSLPSMAFAATSFKRSRKGKERALDPDVHVHVDDHLAHRSLASRGLAPVDGGFRFGHTHDS